MADTGWLNLSAFSTVASGSSGSDEWNSPGNAISSNDLYADTGCGDQCSFDSKWLVGQGVGSVVPDDAIINGIEIRLEGRYRLSGLGNGAADIDGIAVVKGGVVQETVLIDPAALTTSDTTVSVGGATELWGLSWTGTDINASDFGVAAKGDGTQTEAGESVFLEVDHLQVKIYYDENPAMFLTI